jgi:hypothetical protein
LIASGLIAGGALAGVSDGILRLILSLRSPQYEPMTIADDLLPKLFSSQETVADIGNWLALLMFAVLAILIVWNANRAREEEGAGPEISM